MKEISERQAQIFIDRAAHASVREEQHLAPGLSKQGIVEPDGRRLVYENDSASKLWLSKKTR
jgi:hypothetical protein